MEKLNIININHKLQSDHIFGKLLYIIDKANGL